GASRSAASTQAPTTPGTLTTYSEPRSRLKCRAGAGARPPTPHDWSRGYSATRRTGSPVRPSPPAAAGRRVDRRGLTGELPEQPSRGAPITVEMFAGRPAQPEALS